MFKWMNNTNFSPVVALCSLLVLALPVGLANIWLGYVMGESPCTLCWNERIGMVTVGIIALYMSVYGPRLKYIGAMMICAAYGLWMTARHTSLDGFEWDVGMGFGTAMWGAHTYTWGVLVYWTVILVTGLLLVMTANDPELMQKMTSEKPTPAPMSKFVRWVFILSMIVIGSNAIQALFQNGVPPFSGKGEPERFTLDLSTAPQRWTTHVWDRLKQPISLTGANTVDAPYVAGVSMPKLFKFDEDSSKGAIENLKPAPTFTETNLPFQATGFHGNGNASGISYNPDKKMFAIVNTDAGMYLTDENLKPTHRAILDKMNGYDISNTVDTAWVGDKVINTGQNKTLWAIEPTDKIDEFQDWNTFRESTKNLKTSWYRDRPVVNTIRAKKQYVGSIASEPGSDYYYLMSLPNEVSKQSVLIKVDAKDNLLVSELVLKPSPTLKLKEGRNLSDYYITGMTFYKGKILAYSKQYSTLLVINPTNAEVEEAYAMPELPHAHSMTVKDGELIMLGIKDGKDVIYTMPLPTDLVSAN